MKKYSLLCLLLVAALLISGCGNQGDVIEMVADTTQANEVNIPTQVDRADLFSDRDYEVGYDESESAIITLNGDWAECSSNAVQISGSTITIIDEGTYILSGTLNDGMIIVNSEKTDKTQLVLDDVTIHSETSAPIYILQSDKVFITMAPDSVNTLSNGGTFTAIDENNIDGVIFSKEDVTLNGSGTLVITSPAGHGIVSKDSLTITSGTYEISSASHALAGKDNVNIANAAFTITSGKDGIHAENADDTAKGFVYMESGTFEINAEGDGISASANMQIQGGHFNIISGGGSVNAANQTSDSWGGFMGGSRHPDGNRGGGPMGGTTSTDTEDDSTSMKGIKAAGDLVINGGTFSIDSADDTLHSNTNITVGGGTFEIASGDDAFHADETLTITSGTISITESYEGLEGLHIDVSGGNITLVASDDGLNAAGGTDQSGFGGMRGNDQFGGGRPNGMGGMGSGNSSGSITISGGTIHVTASGDGIDANGTLTISGGFTTVCGPTMGDTATLDYDVSAVISGGTFIGTGAAGMAQTFSDSEQGVIAVSVGNQSAGTQIILTDSNGKVVISHTPDLSYGVVILSSPDIIEGATYTIAVGSATGRFTAS
ncbi:MAG: carbohydrate-binding domain-containing protein [Oscillospiraceae bacterium]|nr:carbohydrate-binding domain-containing protein [Oscillospiraceae bacterium]